MFHYNKNKYDFSSVEEALLRYYPIGISKNYYDHKGYKELKELFADNVQNEDVYEKKWVRFEREVAAETGNVVTGTTYGQDNCFSARLHLEKIVASDMVRYKEIWFFVSIAGTFYTVVGIDRNEITRPERVFYSNNFLVISPEPGYEKPFASLCELIENRFMDHQFIPFFIYSQEMEGLHDDFKLDQSIQTVFNALFNRHIDPNIQTVGNKYFGDSAWIKNDYDPSAGGWTIYP